VINFTLRPLYVPGMNPDDCGTGGRVDSTAVLEPFGEEKAYLILLGFKPLFFQAVA
jgi:hypothetical protein